MFLTATDATEKKKERKKKRHMFLTACFQMFHRLQRPNPVNRASHAPDWLVGCWLVGCWLVGSWLVGYLLVGCWWAIPVVFKTCEARQPVRGYLQRPNPVNRASHDNNSTLSTKLNELGERFGGRWPFPGPRLCTQAHEAEPKLDEPSPTPDAGGGRLCACLWSPTTGRYCNKNIH